MLLVWVTLTSVLLAFLSGTLPLFFVNRRASITKFVHFSLLGLSGAGLFIAGLLALANAASFSVTLFTGMLSLSYSFHLDTLSGFFLCVIGMIIIPIAFYGPSYVRYYEKTKQSINSLIFFTAVFVTSMCLVILASNIFSFIFSWELMSLSSYYLVIFHHEEAENRHAGFIYLLMAHLSGLLILCSFGILAKFSGGVDFQTMQTASLTPLWATLTFLFAFLGFGIKSGLIPLHVWLPRAHPAAPSHISALMSGVMIKIAVYGFIRFMYTLIGPIHWQWGVLVLFIGSVSAIFGVLYALMQQDFKRLLAYSSVENIGIIYIGLGLSMIFISNGFPLLGALGLIAALYHCLNHALFKSLLFLGAGSVIQQTHTQNLDHMGGLINKMPQIALFFLIGCLSVSALPPFNGFVSEWLTFQTALKASYLHSGILRILIPVAAATLALTGALAAACFVKVYGIAFLGKPRSQQSQSVKESALGIRFSMGLLALLCLLFGIFPSFIIAMINKIPLSLFQTGLAKTNLHHWLWIMPIPSQASSYSASLVFIGLILFSFVPFLLLRKFSHSLSLKKVSAWSCGFGELSAKMQYTSTAFAMPIRRVFSTVLQIKETILIDRKNNSPLKSTKLKYELQIKDWIWDFGYRPLDRVTRKTTKLLSKLQGGNIRVYLAYTFFTLLLLLWVVS